MSAKFEGYLICSDIDGTFAAGEDTIEVNSKAIKYFTDNGGKFTFVTGRATEHLPNLNFDKIINAPAGVYNGAIIYDFDKECIIYEKRLDYTVGDFADAMRSKLYYRGTLNVCNDCLKGAESVSFEDIDTKAKNLMDIKPLKIVCAFSSVEEADAFKAYAAENKFFSDTVITKSWNTGVEFNSSGGTKGTDVEFIKKYLGNIHTSIGVGDYGNDVSLITAADVGVAVGSAVDELKAVADLVIKPASEYAIKDLIEKIENGVIYNYNKLK